MRRSTTVAVVATLALLAIAAVDAQARRCTRARCRTTIAERCDAFSGVDRKHCVRNLLRECRKGRCSCRAGEMVACDCSKVSLGHRCGTCGTGFCAVAFGSCDTPTCVQRLPYDCNTTGESALTCPLGTASCVFDDPFIGSYYCRRALLAVGKCAAPCP